VAAAALTFLFCFTSFGVMLVLAPAPRFATLEVAIYREVARSLDLGAASALALLQLALVLALAVPYLRANARLAGAVERQTASAPAAGRAWALLAVAPAGLLVAAPLAALVALALDPPGGASLAGAWATLLEPSATDRAHRRPDALANSLRFAALATLWRSLLGGSVALAVVRGGGGGSTRRASRRGR
jgi:thiamine transport system permease protein